MNFRLPYGPPLPSEDFSSGPRAPDIEIAATPFAVIGSGATKPPSGTYGITAVCLSRLTLVSAGYSLHVLLQGTLLLKPSSKGYVELKSASVDDHPIINPKCVFMQQ